MRNRTLAAALAAFTIATTAHAEPVADFKIGTDLYLRTGKVTVAGESSNLAGVPIGKPANTLSFDVPTSAFGLPFSAILHLSGQKVGLKRVQFAFDESFGGPGLAMPGGAHLQHASGVILADVSYVPGNTSPQCFGAACFGDVFLDVLGSQSPITISGDFGTETLTINDAQFIGGVRTPALKSFWYGAGTPICSKSTPTTVLLTARLFGPSPDPGTTVLAQSANPAGVSLPFIQTILAGKETTTITATIAPNFFGTVHLVAASGNGIGSVDLEVLPEHDCDPPPHRRQWRDYNPDWGCIQCTDFFAVNTEGDAVTLVNRRPQVVARGSTMIDPASLLPGASGLSVTALSGNGIVAGSATLNGSPVAYSVHVADGVARARVIAPFSVRGVNQFGTLAGARNNNGVSVAVYEAGRGLVDIPIRAAVSSSASSISDSGQIVGVYSTSAGQTRGFRFRGGTPTDLPTISASPTIPVAQNADGLILATSTSASGTIASLVIGENDEVTRIGAPTGYTSFAGRSMNRAGRVVGTATGAAGTRAFAWNPTTGFIDLTNYVRGLVVSDVLHIDEADQLVVKGTANGRTDLFLLSL